jgi:hypothetical protein
MAGYQQLAQPERWSRGCARDVAVEAVARVGLSPVSRRADGRLLPTQGAYTLLLKSK